MAGLRSFYYVGNDEFLFIPITDKTTPCILTHDDLHIWEDAEIAHRKEQARVPSFSQLIQDFPTAIPAAKRGILARMKEVKILLQIASIDNDSHNEGPALQVELKGLNFRLSYLRELQGIKEPTESGKLKLTAYDIEVARSQPISTYLPVNRVKNALCIFHNDKVASMHIYDTNRYHCFSCGASGTVIDIIMQMYSLKFADAVRRILGK